MTYSVMKNQLFTKNQLIFVLPMENVNVTMKHFSR